MLLKSNRYYKTRAGWIVHTGKTIYRGTWIKVKVLGRGSGIFAYITTDRQGYYNHPTDARRSSWSVPDPAQITEEIAAPVGV